MENKPRVLGSARTDALGQFEIDSPRDQSDSIFFVTAKLGFGVELVTILGSELPSETTVNELATVAASYSMAQFYRKGYISGDPFGLRLAAGMSDNLVTPATGESSEVLLNSPNADETNSLRMTRSLANLLRASVESPLVRLLFFQLTAPARGPSPQNTAVAMANLARDPGRNVLLIYVLTNLLDTYAPALVQPPDAWTVTVKVNDSARPPGAKLGDPLSPETGYTVHSAGERGVAARRDAVARPGSSSQLHPAHAADEFADRSGRRRHRHLRRACSASSARRLERSEKMPEMAEIRPVFSFFPNALKQQIFRRPVEAFKGLPPNWKAGEINRKVES